METVCSQQSHLYLDDYKEDSSAFIFTLKNPHGIPPTRYNQHKGNETAITCNLSQGPQFGLDDISIGNYCNQENSCSIANDGKYLGYECDSDHKKSLFVNTNKPERDNLFAVLDYEVYGIDYLSKHTVYSLCQSPDLVWNYIETGEISEELLDDSYDEKDILKYLAQIDCYDSSVLLRISNHYLKNPSAYLSETSIVDKVYDQTLKDWLGTNSRWKLLYRASEHDYNALSFHRHCDNRGSTLIIIKSTEGWIFGGYTTQPWSGDSILCGIV